MKSIIFGLILGFLAHKIVNEIYDYYWWKNSKYCYQTSEALPESDTLTQCFEKQMGLTYYLQYVLIRPQIGRNKFFSMSRGQWGF